MTQCRNSFPLAFTHLRNFKGDSRFSTWLTTIVTNAALMRLRKNGGRRELRLDEWLESDRHLLRFDRADQRFNPEQLYAQKECHLTLRKAVNELKPGMRRDIELREFEERSIEESARILGISTGAVKSRVFHGRSRLRRLLTYLKYAPMHGNESLLLGRKPDGTLGRQLAHDAGD
jgi:RNA polymerase sigma-70 factor (ECF subfamily)